MSQTYKITVFLLQVRERETERDRETERQRKRERAHHESLPPALPVTATSVRQKVGKGSPKQEEV